MAVCPECAQGDHSNHQPAMAGICIGCECPEVVADYPETEGPPAGDLASDAGSHTGGLNGPMAHHGAAAVASIALPAEHLFSYLRSISVHIKALEFHVQEDPSAGLHLQAVRAALRHLLAEIQDSTFLAELAGRQTKALVRVLDRKAEPHE